MNISLRSTGFINGPLESSSVKSVSAQTAQADPTALATVAKSLSVRVVTAAANAGANIDMMALWPNDVAPTHLIVCNEEGTDKPGVQRVNLSSGTVETILAGTTSCDPVRRTAWGTIIVGEEAGPTSNPATPGGWLLEIRQPITDDKRPVRPYHRRAVRRERRKRRDASGPGSARLRRHRALPERRHVLR